MTIHRFLAWLPLVIITAMMPASKLRAFAMQRRGLRVIVIDWQRPRKDVLFDALLIVVFLFWFYLLLAEAIGALADLAARLADDKARRRIAGEGRRRRPHYRCARAVCRRASLNGHVVANRHRSRAARAADDRPACLPGRAIPSIRRSTSCSSAHFSFTAASSVLILASGNRVAGARESSFAKSVFWPRTTAMHFAAYRQRVGRYGSFWPQR